MWTVKTTYYHPTDDALLLFYLGPPIPSAYSDPKYDIGVDYFRTPDRHYAEIFVTFESKEAYDNWLIDYPDLKNGSVETNAYLEQVGVIRKRFDPPNEDYDWGADPSVSNAGFGLTLEHQIMYEQIFE
jgi:hypothetical protein